MLLYKHATRCPLVIQMFVNFHPIYWCFIPITLQDAERKNENYILPSSIVILDAVNPTAIGSQNRENICSTPGIRSDEEVRSCMRKLPPVPHGYTFSSHQRVAQFQYFKDKMDTKMEHDKLYHLFQVAVVAVLPSDASKAVRQFVESLFITHTEANLNTAGRLVHESYDNTNSCAQKNGPMSVDDWIIDRGEWCHGLVGQK